MLVTGGAAGIGAAVTALAISHGHKVAIADVNLAAARQLAGSLGEHALPVGLDICSQTQWKAALEATCRHFGRLDVLVNNAGVAHPGATGDVPLEAHEHTFKVNVFGPMLGSLAVMPYFREQGAGHIATVCSMTAFLPLPGLVSYAASKHALRAMHLGLALEERGSPIDFTIIHPGATETAMLELEAEKGVVAAFSREPATPAEIAEIVLKAIREKKTEVCIPATRGRVVKAIGANPSRLFELVERNEQVGAAMLASRRARRA